MSHPPVESKDVLDTVWALSLARLIAETLDTTVPESAMLDDLVEALAVRLPGRAVVLLTAAPEAPELVAAIPSAPWAGPLPRLLALTPEEGAAAGLAPEAYAQASAPRPYCKGSVSSARVPLAGPALSGLLCLEREQVDGAAAATEDERVCRYLAGVLSVALAAYRSRQRERNDALRVRQGIDQGDVLVFLTDGEGRLVFSNRALEQITGFPAQELVGRSVRQWVGVEGQSGLASAVDKARSGHAVRGKEVRLPLATGGRVLAIFSVSPVVGADLQVEGAVGVGLSRRQLAALSMRVEIQAVRRAELLGEVAARVSTAASELGPLGAAADPEALSALTARLTHLAAGLETLLHRKTAPFRPVSLNVSVEGALQDVGEEISAHQARVRTVLAGDLPEVQGDPARLRLAFAHLVRNACQALGEHGGRLTVRTWDNRDGTVGLSVADQGVGMDEQWVSRIFQPFVSRPRSAGRLGLGLTVVQDAVEEHDGSLVVDSEQGEGTVVTVTLPVHSVPGPEDKSA